MNDPTPEMPGTSEEKPTIQRDSKGRFPKGVSGCPGGPGKGYRKPSLVEMEKGIKKYQEETGEEYWAAVPILAMRLAKEGNTTLLIRVIDKFFPPTIARIEDEEEVTPSNLNNLKDEELDAVLSGIEKAVDPKVKNG